MEPENQKKLNEIEGQKRAEVKARSSRDGKWLIFRVEGFEQPIILASNFVRAILQTADMKRGQTPANVEQIKG